MASKHNLFIKIAVIALLYAITGGIIAGTLFLSPHAMTGFKPIHAVIIFFASVLLAKYLFYLMASPWHNVWTTLTRAKWKKQRPGYHPLVSVVIPAWNEEVGIVSTMQSLVDSTYRHLEMVVVNDGSTDGSDAAIRSFIEHFEALPVRKRGGKTIVYEYQQNAGKGAALNRAIALSKGSLVISIDADCIVAPATIANFVETFRNPEVMAAVGNVKVGNTETLIGLIQHMEFLFSFYFKKADSLMNTIYIIGGAAGAFRREVFEKLGGYSTGNITEDIELSLRIQDAGYRIVYADDAVVYTEGASDMNGLLSQRLRWKRGRFQTFKAYAHMFFSADAKHNKLLTMVMLPLALFSEGQLFLEAWFLAFLYFYAIATQDFSAFISGIVVVSSMFVVQVAFEDKSTRKASFLVLAPVAWLLFYLMTYVETNALVKSIWAAIMKKDISWQKWRRSGLAVSSM